MTGGGLMDFVIACVGLVIIGGIIFTALEFVSADARFKKIAQFAVGGVLVLAFLWDVKAVFFGGGGQAITPINLIYFAIGVIVLLVVWIIIIKMLDWLSKVFPPIVPLRDIINIVLSAVVLIVLLLMAANLLFGASLGGYQTPFQGRRSQFIAPLPASSAIHLPRVLAYG